jgi:superfamily II DNA or RNA helicase
MMIREELRIELREINPSQRKDLKRAATLPSPEYAKRQRLGLSVWGTDPMIKLWRVEHGELVLPRGLMDRVLDLIPDVIDERVYGQPVKYARSSTIIRDYQGSAALGLITAEQGIVVAGCGAGKTILATAAIRAAAVDTLIVVHTRDLADQWAGVITRELGMPARMIGGGKRKHVDSPVTVATIQTLTKMSPAELKFTLGVGCLIVDEAHHAPASTFDRVVSQSCSRYRWALTATPDRPDGLGPMIELMFGPIVARVAADDLVDRGVLIRPSYSQIRTGWTSDATDHAELVSELAADEDRNDLIVRLARQFEPGSTLVLVNRVEHANTLAAAIGCRALTGATPTAERAEILDAVAHGRDRIVVATTVADEGLDLPILTTLILASPSRAAGRLEQRIGRVCRASPGKTSAHVIDLVDEPSLLRSQARDRARTVQRIWK